MDFAGAGRIPATPAAAFVGSLPIGVLDVSPETGDEGLSLVQFAFEFSTLIKKRVAFLDRNPIASDKRSYHGIHPWCIAHRSASSRLNSMTQTHGLASHDP